ncbi:MAG: hypothetical protein IJV07_02485 [Alphaproteobacteria bacterium]|nr:hypothetical protein [Alphaproteobacteria bacterium]
MKGFAFFLITFCGLPVLAATVEDLLQTNASPDEIINQLEHPTPSLPSKENEFIQIGTIVSLIQNKEDETKYDFTIELLSDGSLITVIQDNAIGLRPGDMVKIVGDNPKIEEKI